MDILTVAGALLLMLVLFSASSRKHGHTVTYQLGTVMMLITIGALALLLVGMLTGQAVIEECPAGKLIC